MRVLKQKFEGKVAALNDALADFNKGFDVICVNAEKAAHGDIIVLVHRMSAESRKDTMLILLFQCNRYMSTVLKRVDCRAELVKMGLDPTREDKLWQILGNERNGKDALKRWLAARVNQLGDAYDSALKLLDGESKPRVPRQQLQKNLGPLITDSWDLSEPESKSPRKMAASNAATTAEAPLEQWTPLRNSQDSTSVISVEVHRVMFVYAKEPEPLMPTDVNANVHFVYCKFGALFPIDVTSTSCSEEREYAEGDDSSFSWT
jgi:hypothetical protein